MISIKQKVKKVALAGIISLLSFTSIWAQDGKQLFQQNCQSCHAINKQLTGPALAGVETRGPWTDRANLYKWIHNPAAFIPTTPYTKELTAAFGGQIMPAFPQLSETDIDGIIDYINKAAAEANNPTTNTDETVGGGSGASDGGGNAVIFGIISIVLAVVALILLQVNSNLKKLSDDKEGILRPEAVPFYRNKIYISLLALVLFVVGGYFVSQGAINMGRQRGYAPDTADLLLAQSTRWHQPDQLFVLPWQCMAEQACRHSSAQRMYELSQGHFHIRERPQAVRSGRKGDQWNCRNSEAV
jgi:cytochrome c2